MVWSFTKHNHNLATTRLVRWWLRTGVIPRLIGAVVVAVVLTALGLLIGQATTPTSFGLGGRGSSPWGFLAWLGPLLLVLVLIDLVWDNLGTNLDLAGFTSRHDVALATRAEYIGGHPKLPDGRFVYLLLEGFRENPMATVLVPEDRTYPGPDADMFTMPVLDVERGKKEHTKLIRHKQLFGYDTRLIVEYAGEGDRKREVEVASFFRGVDEVQKWKNYIVCLQGEADTGKRPFGRWKTLPTVLSGKTDTGSAWFA